MLILLIVLTAPTLWQQSSFQMGKYWPFQSSSGVASRTCAQRPVFSVLPSCMSSVACPLGCSLRVLRTYYTTYVPTHTLPVLPHRCAHSVHFTSYNAVGTRELHRCEPNRLLFASSYLNGPTILAWEKRGLIDQRAHLDFTASCPKWAFHSRHIAQSSDSPRGKSRTCKSISRIRTVALNPSIGRGDPSLAPRYIGHAWQRPEPAPDPGHPTNESVPRNPYSLTALLTVDTCEQHEDQGLLSSYEASPASSAPAPSPPNPSFCTLSDARLTANRSLARASQSWV